MNYPTLLCRCIISIRNYRKAPPESRHSASWSTPHLKTKCPKALVNLKKDCIQPILVIVDLFAIRFLLTSLVLLFLPASIFAGTLRISSNGVPVATIVIPDNPSRAEKFASAELKVHLDKITGGKFRVARENDSLLPRQIHVGRTSLASYFKPQLGPESFTLAYAGTRLAIIGGDESGTLFGVCLLGKTGRPLVSARCSWNSNPFKPYFGRSPFESHA